MSLSMDGSQDSLPGLTPSLGASPAVLLTPGRTRNIAQDMEALRLSRQDNPYLQQVMASRESLIESHISECESDDTILMSQEFGSTALDFVEDDPLTLKEVHEHMIRSPPPISSWPHESMSDRTSSAFDFAADACLFTSHSVDGYQERSPRRLKCFDTSSNRARASRSASPRSHDFSLCGRPLSLPGETHLRTALSRKQNTQSSERFSLLQPSRRRGEDSVRLVTSRDK